MKIAKIFTSLLVLGLLFAQDRPVSTYSIVAIDKESGEMGGAVQSHWFSVGSLVLWAEPGVGIVATQSFVRPEYGPEISKLFGTSSASPKFILESLLKKEVFAKETKIPKIIKAISYIFYVFQKYNGWSIKRQLVG